ncbi:hypothetical protein B0H17DRAFT_1204843 [Mycena rosella]|uniref:Secreted protein n=1 Tax=Mycena rosella TaxID=1033263 RepID=A0AAD7D8J1_MYCRO|nr:hypothetical protein B0H17DRAFT_1204843 [Mycena rosella]
MRACAQRSIKAEVATAIALALVSFSTGAAAATCVICSPTIFFDNVNRTLVLQREEESNTVMPSYSSQNLPTSVPTAFTATSNIDGILLTTNTGATITSLPEACPAIPLVQQASC